jgi:membrane protein implicated in regulation of membrane protease activity
MIAREPAAFCAGGRGWTKVREEVPVGDLLFVLAYYLFPVYFGLVAFATVVAMLAVVVVPWRRRRSRVEARALVDRT